LFCLGLLLDNRARVYMLQKLLLDYKIDITASEPGLFFCKETLIVVCFMNINYQMSNFCLLYYFFNFLACDYFDLKQL
jgi:hypothetical protein